MTLHPNRGFHPDLFPEILTHPCLQVSTSRLAAYASGSCRWASGTRNAAVADLLTQYRSDNDRPELSTKAEKGKLEPSILAMIHHLDIICSCPGSKLSRERGDLWPSKEPCLAWLFGASAEPSFACPPYRSSPKTTGRVAAVGHGLAEHSKAPESRCTYLFLGAVSPELVRRTQLATRYNYPTYPLMYLLYERGLQTQPSLRHVPLFLLRFIFGSLCAAVQALGLPWRTSCIGTQHTLRANSVADQSGIVTTGPLQDRCSDAPEAG